MKTKNFYFLLMALPLLFLSTKTSASTAQTEAPQISQYLDYFKSTPLQDSIYSIKHYFSTLCNKNAMNKDYCDKSDCQLQSPSRSAIFNKSLCRYIKEMYNNKYYADFLSQDGSHIVNFLELSSELHLDAESLYTCIRLFYNKMKACELIDDTVLIQILMPMSSLLEEFFVEPSLELPNQKRFSHYAENLILSELTENLTQFQEDPGLFISQLSEQIGQKTKNELDFVEKAIEEKEMIQRLRSIVIRFLELSLSKVMWNQTAYESIWESILTIANGLQLLAVNGILDHMDDLDDLLWSLTHRICFFLDVAGSYLPTAFYENIENDIANGLVFFLELPEQDEGIKTKKEVLVNALIKAKVKAIAFEKQGIFTDQII